MQIIRQKIPFSLDHTLSSICIILHFTLSTVWHILRLRLIGKSGLDFEIRILQSNAKFKNRFHLREICPQGAFQLRNPNPFDWEIRKRICKTVLVNSGHLFANYACACKQLLLRTVFQILFRISQSNGKNKNPKTENSALKSVFGFSVRLQIRNRDFKI